MLEFIEAIIGAVVLGAFYIAIIYNTYDITYTKSKKILHLVTVGMAVPLALLLFYTFLPLRDFTFGNDFFDWFFRAVIWAPVMEESFKLWIFYIVFFRKKPDMGPFEGMFSFALIGLGFGISENFDYIIRYLFTFPNDQNAYFKIMYFRCFPGHVLYDGIAGYWIGHAGKAFYFDQQNKRSNHVPEPVINFDFIAKGYSIALLAHATWNFITIMPLADIFLVAHLYVCIRLYRTYLRAARPPEADKIEIAYHEMLAYHRRKMKEMRIAKEKDLEHLVLKTIPAIMGLLIVFLFTEAIVLGFLNSLIWG